MEPSLLTLQPQRAPLAVLSMHIPTAVLPSIAQAGADNDIVAKPKKARSKEDVVFIIRISPKLVKLGIERLLPNLNVWLVRFMQSLVVEFDPNSRDFRIHS
jgi:hypothetical protein